MKTNEKTKRSNQPIKKKAVRKKDQEITVSLVREEGDIDNDEIMLIGT